MKIKPKEHKWSRTFALWPLECYGCGNRFWLELVWIYDEWPVYCKECFSKKKEHKRGGHLTLF